MLIQSSVKSSLSNNYNNSSYKNASFRSSQKVASNSRIGNNTGFWSVKKIPSGTCNAKRGKSSNFNIKTMLPQNNTELQANPANAGSPLDQIRKLATLHGYTEQDKLYIQIFLKGKGGIALSFPLSKLASRYTELEQYYNKGLGVAWRRNGSQDDKSCTGWRSLLIEYDDGSTPDEQIERIKKVCDKRSLPFPSAVVSTGGKSLHFYWCFKAPADLNKGKQLQLDLMDLFPGCDTYFTSPVQPSRLPGLKHQETGKYAQLTNSGTGKRYSFTELRKAIPKQKKVKVTKKVKELKQEAELTLAYYEADILAEDSLNKLLNTALSKINRAVEGNNANDAIYDAGLVIGSHILHGLSLETATKKAEEAIEKKGFSNYKKSIDALQNGIKRGVINAQSKAKIKLDSYQLKADETVNREYIGNIDWLENYPVVLLKSAIGTGKTFAIKEYISKLPSTDRILWIAHTKALVYTVANIKDLNFISYDDTSVRNITSLAAVPRLVITMDSLHHMVIDREGYEIPKFDLIVIDESDQSLNHLHTASTAVKKFRRQCVTVFNTLLIHAKKVIGVSATISNLEVEYLSALRDRKNIWVVNNIHKAATKNFVRFNDKELILQEVIKDIEAGKKIYITCNSRKEVIAISTRLKAKYPEKKIEEIHSKNITSQEGLREALTNKDTDLDVDILVVSPSLGTGFDISRSYFDVVYGIFLKIDALSATDLTQAVGRVRYPKTNTVKVLVESGIIPAETNSETLRSRLDIREIEHLYLDTLTGKTKKINPEVVESHLNYASKALARKALYTVDLCNSFWKLIEENGHRIIFAKTDEEIISGLKEGTITSEKEAVQEIKKEIKAEELAKLINTRLIDDLEKEELDKKKKSVLGITEEEQNLLTRYYFDRNTGNKNPTLEYMTWYESKNGKKVAKMLQIEAMPSDYTTAEDIYETEILGKLHIDLNHYVATKFLIAELKTSLNESMQGFTINGQEFQGFTQETLEKNEFTNKLDEYSDLIKTYLNISVSSTQPTKAAKVILESIFGIELESKQIRGNNNTKPRVYIPTEESKVRIENLRQYIQEKFTQHWIEKCKDIQMYIYSSTRTNHRVLELYNLYSKVKAELSGEEYEPLVHKEKVNSVYLGNDYNYDFNFDSIPDIQQSGLDNITIVVS